MSWKRKVGAIAVVLAMAAVIVHTEWRRREPLTVAEYKLAVADAVEVAKWGPRDVTYEVVLTHMLEARR